ncbi:hypothetical protein [Iamia sp.]|uniref:hypothetical protein n=1 Tax=Iamia sp. TaxID=2722710 RepID=UPI002C8A4821|nr:hypothetical protein [Iamia sp.]HXH56581.1 hypothetical protein [Iamia sp.]
MTIDETKAHIVRTLIGLYPNSDKIGKGSEVGYHLALEDLAAELFTRDIWRAILTQHPTFPPNPGELRAFVKNVTSTALGWEQAWYLAMREVRRTGAELWYGPPVFPDDATAAAVRAVGWAAMCAAPDPRGGGSAKDLGFLQARFRDAYEAAVERHRRDDIAAALTASARPALAEVGS